MTKQTFAIAVDPEDNRRYIYQAIDESDKNHKENEISLSNQGRIYEITGNCHFDTCSYFSFDKISSK